jgi:hypothetical protein
MAICASLAAFQNFRLNLKGTSSIQREYGRLTDFARDDIAGGQS